MTLLQGGGWCNDVKSCLERKFTALGSSTRMDDQHVFTGILSNKAQENPDFFNWNRVFVRYCDGASFAGEGEHKKARLQFRGQRIYRAAMEDLIFPRTTRVKCLSDAGLVMDTIDCFFPQNLINYVRTPLFILNAAYDSIQVQVGIAPNISDPSGKWNNGCKLSIANCSASQIEILQKFRNRMVKAVEGFSAKRQNGLFLNSCFVHCQSDSQDTWLSEKPPLIDNLGISRAVGDWYFDRSRVKKIDCRYPCDKTCHNNILKTSPY
ncbi:hypothetical protein Leryth_016717 [Lithospermum erythrorhizon]|nr:hypothetical protein Leryth_016717 [Lithospermum erythrorhizon]